jgi:hypothetical protein
MRIDIMADGKRVLGRAPGDPQILDRVARALLHQHR